MRARGRRFKSRPPPNTHSRTHARARARACAQAGGKLGRRKGGRAGRLTAGRAITAAPINDILFAHRSEEEVRREVRRVVAAGKPGGRFLVGSSTMPLAIPESHIRAMIETARECGRWEPAS